MTEETLFHEARAKANPHERTAFLDVACAGQPELRAAVEALLAADDPSVNFLNQPAVARPTATVAFAPMTEEPGTVVGPYKLLEQIGEGGFGVVYMAEQQEPIRRKVALKILKPGMDTRQVVSRFEAERQALALMEHANIARVFDAGETNSGRPYFVMELVKGIPITRYCDEHQLTPRERLALFVPVCQAIQHAHQKGIVHRDLKPSNVLVATYDGEPVPKVIDFGVAKALGQPLTERTLATVFGGIVGTLEYMSPEQAEFNALDIDTRSDIYSLGVLLYELFTGTTPLTKARLRQAAVAEVLRLIREEDPPRPSTRLSDSMDSLASISAQRKLEPARLTKELRGELDWIVMKCLEKNRNRRYETANDVVRDIERYLNDEAVEAGPPSAVYRWRKFARRNQRLLATASAFLLLLVSGLVVSAWLAARATAAERLAIAERDAKEKARLAEAEQRQRADDEAASAKAVSEFFQKDLLGQADIGNQAEAGERNPNLTVRELLDRTAQRIEAKFKGQELTEAAIRLTLGGAYGGLGEYVEAQEHLERAWALRKQKLGAEHPDTLVSMRNLARLYQERGEYDEAELLYQQGLDLSIRNLGVDHAETLTIMNNLAILYRLRAKYDKAEPLYQQALEGRRRTLGAEHFDTLETMNNLAVLYWNCGRYDEAERFFEQTAKVSRDRVGADHPFTLGCMHNLATLYRSRGRYNEAEVLCQQVLETRRAKQGDDHPLTLGSMGELALVYQARGRYDEAEPLLKQVLMGSRVKLGADHPETLTRMNNLAALYWSMRKFDNSIPLFEELLAQQRKELGADHSDTLVTLANLGINYRDAGRLDDGLRCLEEALDTSRQRTGPLTADLAALFGELANTYNRAGQLDKAESLYRELLEDARTQHSHDDPRTANLLAQLGSNLLQQKKYAGARETLGECLALREKRDPNQWTTFNTKSMLGGALLGEHKYAEAEPLLVEGYEGMKERDATLPQAAKFRLSQALERLVKLYGDWGKPDVAVMWRQKLDAQQAGQKE